MLQWILILPAIVGIELCVKNAFAFPKGAHPFFAFIEDLVEFVGLPAGKPFNGVVPRYTTFHRVEKNTQKEYTGSTANSIIVATRCI
jgi:hypothetical protein